MLAEKQVTLKGNSNIRAWQEAYLVNSLLCCPSFISAAMTNAWQKAGRFTGAHNSSYSQSQTRNPSGRSLKQLSCHINSPKQRDMDAPLPHPSHLLTCVWLHLFSCTHFRILCIENGASYSGWSSYISRLNEDNTPWTANRTVQCGQSLIENLLRWF